MANKKLSEGVGKKIVEALKKQSEIEINPIPAKESREEGEEFTASFGAEQTGAQDMFQDTDFLENLSSEDSLESLTSNEMDSFISDEPVAGLGEVHAKTVEQSFGGYQQSAHSVSDSFMKELDNFEIPSNIAVLKKLISQLPSGVTRHTGAQIIKQTMEALGISMKSVLQEAQQVQDGLNNSAKECRSTIQEYKKQILLLEKQAQNYQRQYAALNELISLFIQTGV